MFFYAVFGRVLAEQVPMVSTVVKRASVFQDLAEEAIRSAGERGVRAAKIAAADFWRVVVGWGHGG